MSYPTLEEVEEADHEQICRWCRFLPSPGMDNQEEIMNLICKRWKESGGFTPELSKKIGWEKH